MYYKSNKNKNKSIDRKCNKNLTVNCPGQQPFAATRNNNIKDRKNRDFVAFSISIIAHPEINFSGLELLSAQVDSSLLSVITLVTVSGQQQRINQAQTALFKLADKPGNDVEQLDPLTYKNTRVSLSDTLQAALEV